MARRKRAFLEDSSDSSEGSQQDDIDDQGFEDNDPDARAERSLFEDPYQRKKRRVGGKDDATYGSFADDDEDEGFGRRDGRTREKRLHFTQAPAFVTGETKISLDMDDEGEVAEESDAEEDRIEDDPGKLEGVEDDLSDEHEAPGRGAQEEVEEDKPSIGMRGLLSAARQFASAGVSGGGIGSGVGPGGGMGSRGGIGSGGGIGSSRLNPGTPAGAQSLPEAFGSAPHKPPRSFLRDGTGSATSSVPGTPKLSREEQLHFNKIQGSLGARLMAKMGWEAGTGLGASAEGIVTPVESKLRPKASMGLAFRGFKERTAQSKAEARRRGEIVSDDEDAVPTRKSRNKIKDQQQERSDAWKKPKKTKVKVQHQTYEQIVQNIGQEAQTTGIGKIYDATGGEMREVSSIADISSSWTPSTDAMRIPEVRHNLRLIVDVAKGDLDGLAREGRALEERKKWIRYEDARLRRKVGEEAELIARLQSVHLTIDEIKSQSQSSSADYEPSLDAFSPYVDKLVAEFGKEYEVYRLDEIVIGAISPVVRGLLASWNPLKDPNMLADVFGRWKRALKFSVVEESPQATEIDAYGARGVKKNKMVQDLTMTPYESLMWNAWLPKVRSCINNDWSPLEAAPAVQLYEAWSNLLPPFIRDNMLDQLIIPKVQKAIAEWQPRGDGPTLQAIVFPWLPHVGLRIEELLGDARRKVKSLLRSWVPSDGVPEGLAAWKQVFGSSDWDAMTMKYILPKLGAALRKDFAVLPDQVQDMTVFNRVMQWRSMFRGSVFVQLLEAEFFPKWLEALHKWLIGPNASFEHIRQWYALWKGAFPQEVLNLLGEVNGFTRGLDLMNEAIALGPDSVTKLARPESHERKPIGVTGSRQGSRQSTPHTRRTPARAKEITFRSIVEEFAASHDLLFIPTGKAHEKSRMPLFRVSHSVDGKGGVLVFILDDAVWAVEGDDYRAIPLEEMVLRANKPR